MDTTLIDALRTELQRETGQPVGLVETHISWVLLTPTQALKLKKPVRLPFLDFGSVESRKHFCEEELRLNRRFAPALYLDVAPVCGTRESPRVGDGAGGAPIDHVVRMRRFAESALLRNLLTSNALEPRLLDGFARRLADLHGEAQRAAPVSGFGAPEAIVRAANDVLASLRAQVREGEGDRAASLDAIGAWIDEQGQALRMAWIARQQGGAVRECHGDLHLANVVLVDGALTPFDCIEFDPALRWIDVMSDVAFLTMDLKAHDHGELAFRFLDAWLQHSGDYAGLQVLRFYEVYRALVRAMASGMTPGGKKGPDYLACARRLVARPEEGARLMIAHGLSGSGKSSVALQLLCAAGAVRVRSDVERKRLFGLAPLERSATTGLDIYDAKATRRTFERLRACARDALLAGYPVIVDAAFLRRAERHSFEALATELRVPFSILDCSAAPAALRRRVAERETAGTDASEAGLAVLERQLATHEPLDADEHRAAIEVSTEDAVDIAQLRARWRSADIGR